MGVGQSLEGSGYTWGVDEQRYHAAEDGRARTFVQVHMRRKGNAFNPWGYSLVEPCPTAHPDGGHAHGLPCWPDDARRVDQKFLAAIQDALPSYRGRPHLLFVASGLNTKLSPSRPGWVVGTRPFAVAFLSEEAAAAAGAPATARPRDLPAAAEGGEDTAAGPIPVAGERAVRLVADGDLKTPVDTVLVFQGDIDTLYRIQLHVTKSDAKLKVVELREHARLREVIDVVGTTQLTERARRTSDVPVE